MRKTNSQRAKLPDWARAMEKLREDLQLSQAAMAKHLAVTPMAVSRWERGIHRPPAEIFVAYGKLAGRPGCWYYWKLIGLSRDVVEKYL
jgi:transcriptional regulator with XRE-family HTH domain